MALTLLILGGTTEASRLAAALAGRTDVAPVLSFAGRTRNPVLPPIPSRIGGFGGVEGLVAYLREQAVGAVIDATHPFAARISAHAAEACARLALPRAAFTRPPWRPEPADRWTAVPDVAAAAAALGAKPRRVFLTVGRLGLVRFKAAPQHDYLVRTIDPPQAGDCPPRCRVILARPSESAEAEAALMQAEGIEMLVSKNSGGTAGLAKLDAARQLGLPVVMVDRPTMPPVDVFTSLAGVEAWLARHGAARP